MDPKPGVQGLPQVAYDLSLRTLRQQENVVNALRGRTGTLLAASALVASFLGSRAVNEGPRALTVLALVAFAASVVACLYILLPRPDLVFGLRGTTLFEVEVADPRGLDETLRRLTYWIEDYRAANEGAIERLYAAYRLATAAVALQVVLWSAEVALI
jgi:hypothetical protein